MKSKLKYKIIIAVYVNSEEENSMNPESNKKYTEFFILFRFTFGWISSILQELSGDGGGLIVTMTMPFHFAAIFN